VFPGDIGDIGFPHRAIEHYTDALTSAVDVRAVRGQRFKVVVDYACGTTAFVMPNVLSKLGADVLAVNPYGSTPGAINFQRRASAIHVGNLVQSSGAQLGVVIDPDGEHATFIDDEGRVLSDIDALLAFVHMVSATTGPGCRVALPVTVTSEAEHIAGDHGSEVVWTKVSTTALMAAALSEDVSFAGSTDGGFIFPEFLPAFDGMAAFAKMLELLVRTGSLLSKVVTSLPRAHVAHETVATPWEQKGLVMRTLIEQASSEVVLIDGVKVTHGDGWALALPDPEQPVTHVWAEAGSDGDARRLAQEYVRRVRRMLR